MQMKIEQTKQINILKKGEKSELWWRTAAKAKFPM